MRIPQPKPQPSVVWRDDATDDEFAERVAAIDAAPDAEESLRERVAHAMYVSDLADGHVADYLDFADLSEYRNLADAAIAVMRGDDA